MNYPPPSWHSWPPPSPPHSTELEHRLTKLERHDEWQEDHLAVKEAN